MKAKLLELIDSREMVACVVGLGYVGLPLAVELAKSGFRTIGIDLSEAKVAMVNKGENYIGDINDDELRQVVDSGMLSATTDFAAVSGVNFVSICVPTPLTPHQQPDISFVESAAKSVAEYLTPCSIVVLESTTYPGTTVELLKPILEEGSGLRCGKDFYLGFSPERIDPGNAKYRTKNTPKIVGAISQDGNEVISAMYSAVLSVDIHCVSSPSVAEMAKILENTFRNVNIGLINELAILCNKMDINIWEVIDAAKTKPFGFMPFYPGPGLGGHCIPLDPYYLSWKAREYGVHTTMIENSMIVNDSMPEYVVRRSQDILNNHRKTLSGSKVLVLGVAYKANINDYRESPAIEVIDLLRKGNADVTYYDPYISEYSHKGKTYRGHQALTPELIRQQDLVVIATGHKDVDYQMVQQNAIAVFDTRNATKALGKCANIELL